MVSRTAWIIIIVSIIGVASVTGVVVYNYMPQPNNNTTTTTTTTTTSSSTTTTSSSTTTTSSSTTTTSSSTTTTSSSTTTTSTIYPIIHGAILIQSDAELTSFPNKTGSGTFEDPYVIKFIKISNYVDGYAITILNTRQYLNITNITILGCKHGIRINNITNINILDSFITYTYSAGFGINIQGNDILIQNNTIQRSSVDFSHGIYVSGSNVNITNNIIRKNYYGVGLYGWSYNENGNTSIIHHNLIDDCISGLELTNFYHSSITNNTIFNDQNDAEYGLKMYSLNFSVVENNLICLNAAGFIYDLDLYHIENVTVYNNIVNGTGSSHWFYLRGFVDDNAKNVTIFQNNCSVDTTYMYRIQDILIYYNNFKARQAASNEGCSNCDFDNGTDGNWWGNYETQYPSATNDGHVWDTAYEVIYLVASDNYPLVNQIFVEIIPIYFESLPEILSVFFFTLISAIGLVMVMFRKKQFK